ncbi:MAG: hypothetical protein Q9220_002117 [cf. Caloplaca sp. 1 TL-2023]
MVLLSMTSAIVDAIRLLQTCPSVEGGLDNDDAEPELGRPAIGRPITHTQVIKISKLLKNTQSSKVGEGTASSLDDLLRGSKIYVEPPKQKTEPTNEYKILMARLRREEEARVYERMTNPPLPLETFEQRFPNANNSKLFAGSQSQIDQDDEVTYADINRQMALIFNILLSIVACSVSLWLVASRWSTPRRLALSMGGSVLIAVAEAVVYTGYLRRVQEAREKGKKQIEIKEIIKTWVIGEDEKVGHHDQPVDIEEKSRSDLQLRQRRIRPT